MALGTWIVHLSVQRMLAKEVGPKVTVAAIIMPAVLGHLMEGMTAAVATYANARHHQLSVQHENQSKVRVECHRTSSLVWQCFFLAWQHGCCGYWVLWLGWPRQARCWTQCVMNTNPLQPSLCGSLFALAPRTLSLYKLSRYMG